MSKPQTRRAEKYQASFFRYPSLGFIAYLMPDKLLRYYCMKRFFEQTENQQRQFERMLDHNERRRNRMMRKIAK